MAATAKDMKLIQYLNEAYGKEKELETALQAHISLATRATYKKRLQQHLQETKRHGREVERRIKQLGGNGTAELAATVQSTAARAVALAQGPLHAVRGTGEAERQLKNAKTEYANEAEEIATYTAIEALAETVGDRDTAQLARAIRREEERMGRFLEGLIPQLTRAVAQAEIPASQRRTGGRRRGRSRSTSSRRSSSGRSRSGGGGGSRSGRSAASRSR
jgi:ferritin-like metal-binding protein YciE